MRDTKVFVDVRGRLRKETLSLHCLMLQHQSFTRLPSRAELYSFVLASDLTLVTLEQALNYTYQEAT